MEVSVESEFWEGEPMDWKLLFEWLIHSGLTPDEVFEVCRQAAKEKEAGNRQICRDDRQMDLPLADLG